jgi:hypothetical protein
MSEPVVEQARDAQGRFVEAKPPPGLFDGGARTTPPLPSDPLADHNQLVAGLLAARRVQRSPGGWVVEA